MRRLAVLLLLAACTHPSRPAPTPTLTLTYDVTQDGATHQQVIDLDRPYRARVRTGAVGTITTERGVYTLTTRGPQLAQETYPARPGADSYLDVALPVLASQGLVRRDGTGTVLGTPCTWWLSQSPLESVPVRPATPDEHTRSCVDPDGLVLSSTETLGGKAAITRVLVKRERTPALTDQVLFGGAAPSGGAGVLKVKVLDVPPSPPLAVTAQPPGAGWTFASGAVFATLGAGGAAESNGDRTVYVRNGRLAVLEEYQRLDAPTAPPTEGEELPDGGRLTAGYDGLTLTRYTRSGVLVRLIGHLTRAEIVAWDQALSR